MGQAIVDVALTPLEKAQPPTPSQQVDGFASMIERLACDPTCDVDKFERLMLMREREQARRAQVEFDAAMNLAQNEMEPVRKDAYNKQTSSKYASFEKLDEAVRPIYTKHGFGLSFDTGDAPHQEEVRMLCYVSHSGGHRQTYKLDLPADGKGAKGGDLMTRTHATVSATSYGQRVLLRLIFNIAVGGDDDGNRAGRTQAERPEAPDGFDKFWKSVSEAAKKGVSAFDPAWECGDAVWKNYAVKHLRTELNELKATARAAGRQER